MTDNLTVFIVDDDAAIRDALSLLLGIHDYRVALFADAESFLSALKPTWRGCLLLDIRMPGMDGLTLQKHLVAHDQPIPVIIMTGHGDVHSAREAFRAMALDFLEKPLDHQKLLSSIDEAFRKQRMLFEQKNKREYNNNLLSTLTPRETEVMCLVVAGQHNREIAAELNISTRTVEVHKARILDKLGISSVAELVRLQIQATGI